jgi:hypothetical protein
MVTKTTPNKRSLKISKPEILANNIKNSYMTETIKKHTIDGN